MSGLSQWKHGKRGRVAQGFRNVHTRGLNVANIARSTVIMNYRLNHAPSSYLIAATHKTSLDGLKANHCSLYAICEMGLIK